MQVKINKNGKFSITQISDVELHDIASKLPDTYHIFKLKIQVALAEAQVQKEQALDKESDIVESTETNQEEVENIEKELSEEIEEDLTTSVNSLKFFDETEDDWDEPGINDEDEEEMTISNNSSDESESEAYAVPDKLF
jgi:predicted DNA-binding ArsR family transcriptional regulator